MDIFPWWMWVTLIVVSAAAVEARRRASRWLAWRRTTRRIDGVVMMAQAIASAARARGIETDSVALIAVDLLFDGLDDEPIESDDETNGRRDRGEGR